MTMKRLLAVCCALFVALAFASPAVAAGPSHKPPKAPAQRTVTKPAPPHVKASGSSTTSQTGSNGEDKDGGGDYGKKVESKDDQGHKK
jgi:hypothetical protein